MNPFSRVCVSSYTPVLQSLASSIMPWKEDDTAKWKWFIPRLPYKEPSQLSLQKLPTPSQNYLELSVIFHRVQKY